MKRWLPSIIGLLFCLPALAIGFTIAPQFSANKGQGATGTQTTRPPIGIPLSYSGPILDDDAGTVAHVYWNGTALVDTKGNAWTMNGVVPQVTTSPLFGGGTGAGRRAVGPYSAANNFVAPNNTVGEFAGDWSGHIAFVPTSFAAVQLIFAKLTAIPLGWAFRSEVTGKVTLQIGGDTTITSGASAVIGALNVASFGRSGGTYFLKLNSGTTVTKALGVSPSPGDPLRVGRYGVAGFEASATSVYECTLSLTAFDEASVAAIQAAALANGDPNRPLFPNDTNTVLHLIGNSYNGTTWRDLFGITMTTNGVVSYSDAFVPNTGLTRDGAGPYSGVNYYSLGAGNDVLDFAGDFSACFVYSKSLATNEGLFEDGNEATTGYRLQDNSGQVIFTGDGWAAVKSINDIGATAGGSNVVCFGRSGGSMLLKVNLRALVTGTPTAPYSPGVGNAALLGKLAGLNAINTTIYEAWFSTTTPSDALFTKIQQRFLGLLSPNQTQYPITVTRTTPQTYIVPAASGQTLWTAPPNTLAMGVNGAEIYAAATNYVLQSETSCVANAVQAPWTLAGTPTCTTDTGVAPNGTTTADTWTNATNTHGITQTLTTASSAVFTYSGWVSKAATGAVSLGVACGAGTAIAPCTCGTSDGSACSANFGGATCLGNFTAVGAAPVRVWTVATCSAALTNPTISFTPGQNGVSTGTANFWGVSVTPTPYPMPYITTVAAAVAQSATVATVPLPALHMTNRWCIGVTVTPGQAWNTTGTRVMWSNSTGVPSDYTNLFNGAGSIIFSLVDSGGGSRSVTWVSGLTTSVAKRLVAYTVNGTLTLYADGAPVGAAAGAGTGLLSQTRTSISLGNQAGVFFLDGSLRDIKIVPNPKSWTDCN